MIKIREVGSNLSPFKIARTLKVCLVIYLLFVAEIITANDTITLGILAYLPKDKVYQRYQPLADYLNEFIPDKKVRLLPLSYNDDQVEQAINDDRLDLLLTNPSHFIKLRATNNLSGAMLTQVVLRNGEPVSSFGGVIVTHAYNQEINTLEDLVDKRIAAADLRSLGGYQAQLYEILQADVELAGRFEFLKKHNKVITAVLDGRVDAGFVRSGVIETLIKSGVLEWDQIKIINPKSQGEFPFRVSTDLYPEWPLLALPRMGDRDIRRIASALLALDANHPAAIAANIGGFDPPADYLSVETIMRTLRLPPYDQPPEFTFSDIWTKYRLGIITLTISISIIFLLSFLLWRRSVQLSQSAESLRRAASVFSHASEGIIITDSQGIILDVNTTFEAMTGYSRGEVVGKPSRVLRPDYQESEFYKDLWIGLNSEGEWQGEIWNKHKNGGRFAVQLAVAAIKKNDKVDGYVGLGLDITHKLYLSTLEDIKRKAMQSALEGIALERILDQVLIGTEMLSPGSKCSILLLDESGKHLMVCSAPSLPKLYNQTIDGIGIGDGVGSCGTAAFRQERVVVEDIQQHPYWAAFKALAASHELGSCWSEPIFGKKNRLLGTFAIYHANPCTPMDKDFYLISKTVGLISLLIEVQQTESDLKRMATTDELTSLPNRREFMGYLQAEFSRAKRYKHPLSVCMLDLDHFKKINDNYGHGAGDVVLKEVANIMTCALREMDQAGRLGG